MTITEFTPDELVDDESEVDDDTVVPAASEPALTYFGADFDVAGLVRRLEKGDIVIPQYDPETETDATIAGFQRPHVWTPKKMEAFIESLLLGWPVPSIFLVLDRDQRYLVLDGQQRINTLAAFYQGTFPDGKPFVLKDVVENLKDTTFETLSAESRRKLENTFIQATVIEPKGPDGADSVYKLFGRLNSGGMSLTAQEIRVALYRGDATDLIRDLNRDPSWRELFGQRHKRLKDHELILRALAMLETLEAIDGHWKNNQVTQDAYRPPISEYLNSYLVRHQHLDAARRASLLGAFARATGALLVADPAGLRLSAGSINAAHVDALVSVLMRRAERERLPSQPALAKAVEKLKGDKDYVQYVTRSTSHRDSVLGRLRIADAVIPGR